MAYDWRCNYSFCPCNIKFDDTKEVKEIRKNDFYNVKNYEAQFNALYIVDYLGRCFSSSSRIPWFFNWGFKNSVNSIDVTKPKNLMFYMYLLRKVIVFQSQNKIYNRLNRVGVVKY